jgi:hypothetical protein
MTYPLSRQWPLEPSPLLRGKSRFNICQPEACGLQCVKKCPAKALPGDGTIDHFKCRNYRNPGAYTLEYFKAIAESKKPSRPASGGAGAKAAPPGWADLRDLYKGVPHRIDSLAQALTV